MMQKQLQYPDGVQCVVQHLFAFALVVLSATAVPAIAQSRSDSPQEPQVNAAGDIQEKIVHRLNPQVFVLKPWETHAKSQRSAAPPAGSTGEMLPAITYNGGPVMPSLSSIYIVWYGNWNQSNGSDTPAGQQIIRDALYGLSQNVTSPYTDYTGITTGELGTYYQASGSSVTQVSSPTIYQYTDAYSQGTRLSDSRVLRVVRNAIANGGGAWSTPSGSSVYLVLTSSDVAETSGFCSVYCAWHTYTTSITSTPIKYAFVGNANRCLNACSVQTNSPNGNAGVDAMVSTLTHELEESVTDPVLNAWYDSRGSENADKCAWTFGQSLLQTSSGAYYNVTLPTSTASSRNYLIQRALSPTDSKCYVSASPRAQ